MTQREQQILALIREDPLISQRAIAEKLDISRSAVAGHVMKMTNKGIIKGRGYVISDEPFVVTLGGASMDVHGSPNAALRPRDSNPGTVQMSPGGVARNIAENLARLGIDCRLIAALGDDHYGDLLVRQGRAAGIDMQYVLRLDGQATSTYLSVLDESGDMIVGISDMSVLNKLDAERLQHHERLLRQAAVIVIDTNLGDSALAYLTGKFAEQVIFVDTVSTTKAVRIKPYLNAVHTILPSRIEAEELSGMSGRNKRGLKNIARWFHDQGVQRVFVTLGRKGVFFSAEGEQEIVAPVKTSATVNANGAGDAFAAGMTAAWLNEWPLGQSVEFALAAAGHTLANPATVSTTLSVNAVQRLCERQHVI